MAAICMMRRGNRYLDCIAAYGALPFGHNPAAIWEEINRISAFHGAQFYPAFSFGCCRELARRLVELAPEGLEYVTFANSGTEAVEAAIKMCRASTGRPGILSTETVFTVKPLVRFLQPVMQVTRALFVLRPNISAIFPTVMQKPSKKNLKQRLSITPLFWLNRSRAKAVLLNLLPDTCRGLKRSAASMVFCWFLMKFRPALAGQEPFLPVNRKKMSPPMCWCLAKALGGGVMPIGACLSADAAYSEDFGLKHSSTFAGNSLACRVGIKVLDLLTEDKKKQLKEVRERVRFL
jgi:hypothetical protein